MRSRGGNCFSVGERNGNIVYGFRGWVRLLFEISNLVSDYVPCRLGVSGSALWALTI